MTETSSNTPSGNLSRNQLAIVAQLAIDLSRCSELQELYDLAVDALLDVLPIDRASLLLFDDQDVMRFVASRHLSPDYISAVEGHSPWTRQAVNAAPIVVEDVLTDQDLAPHREAIVLEGIRALAFIPLESTGGLLGKFMLYVDRPHRFDRDDINLAWAIATHLALAIERARGEAIRSTLMSELRKERNTLRFLSRASELLTSTLDPDSILSTIALLAVPTVADWCAIDLLAEDGSVRRVTMAHKDIEKVRWAKELQEKYPPSNRPEESAVARVINSGAPELYATVTDEMLRESAIDEEHLRALRQVGMTSAMIVPLTARGSNIGCVTFVSCESNHQFGEDDLSLATDLAQRAALAVDNSRLFERERRAREDAEENATRISRLQEVTAALSEATTPDSVADVIIDLGIRAFDAQAGLIAIRNGHHAELIRTKGFEASYIEQFRILPLDDPDRIVPTVRAILSGEPVLIASEEQLRREFPYLDGRTTGSHHAFAAIPLTLEGRTFGTISLSFSAARTFSTEDREFLLALGRHCAQALDRARLYEAEHEAREEAESANRAKDDFLAALSHEMRTPLTSALGWARMLDRDELDAETQRQAAAAIYRSTRSQVRIVEDLLDVSRIIAGKMTIQRDPLDLSEVVEGAVDLLRAFAEEHGVSLETDLQPMPLLGDEERLRQVFWNLLSNAIKFSFEGGIVRLTMRRIGDYAEVRVADGGRGIDPEFLPHLFERFRQADSGTTRSYGGLGLGLSIVHHLVHLHGGTVEASSEGSAKGAVFTVRLPIATEERKEIYQGGTSTPRDLEGARIIVVEDQIDSRLMIETILERAGGRVRSAAAPSEARRMIRESPPELIISDIAMPGEDGLAFIQGLRATGDGTPALALTAYGREEEERAVIRAGFDGFLRKPVDPDALLQTVSQLLYKRRS